MTQPLLRKATTHILTATSRPAALFGTSSAQWFRRFLSPKEEKQLYMGITTLFREKLVEKSTPSNQSYSNIIDHIILAQSATSPTPLAASHPVTLIQLGQLKQDIDTAGKAHDLSRLDTLWLTLQRAGKSIPTTVYNRLIRAYLACPNKDGFDKAKKVMDTMDQQRRLPTTRTCIYLIQAIMKRDMPLEEARHYVNVLHRYSLNKMRTAFDCNVMMQYYIKCGNAHAIDFLWRDTMRHCDVIQPAPSLYTQYMQWLLSSHASHEQVADAARSLVQRFAPTPATGSENETASGTITTASLTTTQSTWTNQQLSVCLNVVRLLAHSNASPSYCNDAEKLLLCLVNITDTITPSMAPNDTNNNNTNSNSTKLTDLSSTSSYLSAVSDTSTSTSKQGTMAIHDIIQKYLEQAQDLKVLAFYYRLRKSGVSEDAFGSDLTQVISNVLGRVEIRQDGDEQIAIAHEFGLTVPPS